MKMFIQHVSNFKKLCSPHVFFMRVHPLKRFSVCLFFLEVESTGFVLMKGHNKEEKEKRCFEHYSYSCVDMA